MEVRICLKNEAAYQINEAMDFEEMDGRAYFYIHTTDKVVVMDEPSYTLWQCILQCAQNQEVMTIPVMKAFYDREYTFDEAGESSFAADMAKTVHFLAHEEFLLDVL